jgi:hypothetical protein
MKDSPVTFRRAEITVGTHHVSRDDLAAIVTRPTPMGGTVVAIGLKAHVERGAPLLYQPAQLVPEAGELYAVYFGTAFHLGVYLGEGDGSGEIVHFLDDGKVHRWTWEQFLEAREPHHWTYPDLPETPLEDIRAIARGEIGKEYPYNLLRFNCEHFAIYCKSGGRATTSGYAQVPAIFADVAKRPFLGMVAELNTRIVEFLAFHLGGPAGKRLSLTIRRMGHAVTGWLLVRGGARRAVGRPEQTRSPSPTTPG